MTSQLQTLVRHEGDAMRSANAVRAAGGID
jgi:hypothetical protein